MIREGAELFINVFLAIFIITFKVYLVMLKIYDRKKLYISIVKPNEQQH